MRRSLLVVPVLLLACDDHLFLPHGGTIAPGGCGVAPILHDTCGVGGCHDAATANGGLDLQTDPLTAIVGVDSVTYPGNTYVVAGDSSSSFLYQKLTATQPDGTGSKMPIGAPLGDTELAAIKKWIDDGATPCEATPRSPCSW